MTTEECKWVQIKVLLRPADKRRLEDASHLANLPTAVFVREILLGRTPKAVPPAQDEMSVGAVQLLKIAYGLISNFSQLEAHCARLGDPLSRLAGVDGELQKMSKQARAFGLKIKSGAINDQQIKLGLDLLEPASLDLNSRLARPMNEGKSVDLVIWKHVLSAVKTALLSQDEEARS